jgi:hypothetical protein
MSQHLTPELIDRLDAELAAAIRAVETGLATTATVALAFAVGLDDDARPEVSFVHKHGAAKKGSFSPARQLRLELDEVAEARR